MRLIKQGLASLYGAIIRARNSRFEAGKGIQHVDVPVVSIGNITTGGTGKSPVTQFIVRLLQQHGYSPAIVSRGYGRKSKGVVVVRDANAIVATVEESGDEAMMHAEALNIPVVVSEKRVAGAELAVREFKADVVVLDDGFQHRMLHRDVDIVVLDRNSTRNAHLLPLGRLREPASALKRASFVLSNNVSSLGEITRAAPGVAGSVFSTVAGPMLHDGVQKEPPHEAVLLSSIAHSERFRKTIQSQGTRVAEHVALKDHAWFTAADVQNVVDICAKLKCQAVIVTAKDYVKLQAFKQLFGTAGIQLLVQLIEVQVYDDAALTECILRGLSHAKAQDKSRNTHGTVKP